MPKLLPASSIRFAKRKTVAYASPKLEKLKFARGIVDGLREV